MPTAEEIRAQFAPTTCEPAPLITNPAPRRITIDQVITAVAEQVSIRPIAKALDVTKPVEPPTRTGGLYVDKYTLRPGDHVDLPEVAVSHLLTDARNWDWQQLRDYVVGQITERFGVFPRNAMKEQGTFTSFAKRYGELAGPIAVQAFTVHKGMWRGAPISTTRFCKGSDAYFAEPLAEIVRNVLAHR